MAALKLTVTLALFLNFYQFYECLVSDGVSEYIKSTVGQGNVFLTFSERVLPQPDPAHVSRQRLFLQVIVLTGQLDVKAGAVA